MWFKIHMYKWTLLVENANTMTAVEKEKNTFDRMRAYRDHPEILRIKCIRAAQRFAIDRKFLRRTSRIKIRGTKPSASRRVSNSWNGFFHPDAVENRVRYQSLRQPSILHSREFWAYKRFKVEALAHEARQAWSSNLVSIIVLDSRAVSMKNQCISCFQVKSFFSFLLKNFIEFLRVNVVDTFASKPQVKLK